ncbi:ABC transporter ATP-binding protein [Actinomadura rubrisoli]|uniref:ABC transporter ATP-binding protein n=1 Tax=Actinomadura rubrisoli TaxID=2530368 RepID=A0A4R5B3P9_9ACTN|nr:ABC transporter ATP-binding protein [Actinomadura rubrisoli]TDD79160.1 ABC transporter ATP-binding protein [Actinomadura rubrisoli]
MSHEDPIPVLQAEGLTKRYGRRVALSEVDLRVPAGRVVGLVGPNGAGKTTLLNLACGLLEPTSGSLRVLGSRPAASAAHLARVGFVAQNTPVYPSFSVADHLRLGARLNPCWDQDLAERRISRVGLNPGQKAGRLSGGQRAQLALTIAAAKRPELLIFDEPAAALDPLAREGFLVNLMEFVADLGASAVLSSHLLGDIEQICDYLIVLCEARVQIAGEVEELLAGHRRLVARREELARLPAGVETIRVEHEAVYSSAVVRTDLPWSSVPFRTDPVSLEELVLGYMSRANAPVAGVGAAALGGRR